MRRRPPGDGLHARVLHPHQQQQQAENRLNVDGEEEECVDFERHSGRPKGPRNTNARPTTVSAYSAQAVQTMKTAAPARAAKIMVNAAFTTGESLNRQRLAAHPRSTNKRSAHGWPPSRRSNQSGELADLFGRADDG